MSLKVKGTLYIPISEEDIRLFQALVDGTIDPFEWRFQGVDVRFVKAEEDED